jgi:hypothetical protein
MSIKVNAFDGYRMQRITLDIDDSWHQDDYVGCLETMGMSAAGLIKAIEASGIAVYGGNATEGFAEAYRDETAEWPQLRPLDAS